MGDPRSPTIECTRTPLMVESHEPRKRLGALKPSKLAQLSEPSTPSSDKDDSIESDDPRSPTIKVPRTPLQDKLQEFDSFMTEDEGDMDENADNFVEKSAETAVKEETVKQPENLEKRKPLAAVNKKGAQNTPKGFLQAKQCRNVEEEYSKTQQKLITQLSSDQENTPIIPSTTTLVDTI